MPGMLGQKVRGHNSHTLICPTTSGSIHSFILNDLIASDRVNRDQRESRALPGREDLPGDQGREANRC